MPRHDQAAVSTTVRSHTSSSLREWRDAAARASAGTSSVDIQDHVLRLLRDLQPHGSILDFGAGTGELLARLLELNTYRRLAGIDLFRRPDWLPASVSWSRLDLNEPLPESTPIGSLDAVVCTEVIEHLENPRQVFRTLASLLKPGGVLVLTTPNIECLRSLGGLVIRGHYTPFLDGSYPAHITPLLRKDLERLCRESRFEPPTFTYPNDGAVPGLTRWKWRKVSAGMLRGRWFSDTLAMHARLSVGDRA
jgi:2-polyprenyl-3-methyl-5-hydroxy-6-metoxy-1,4-benzoquinol methylase